MVAESAHSDKTGLERPSPALLGTPALALGGLLHPEGLYRFVRLGMFHCTSAELSSLMSAAVKALSSAGFDVHSSFSRVPPLSLRGEGRAPQAILAVTTSEPAAGPTGFQESATALFGELNRHEVWGVIESRVESPTEAVALEVTAQVFMPFTSSERSELSALNPLVGKMVGSYARSGFDLSDTTLFFREHLLLEKMNLLAGLLELGLEPARTIVIGKPDATFYRHRVVAQLRSWGITVLDSLDSVAEVIERFAAQPSASTIVVDDGGDLALDFLRSSRSPGRLAVLETTAKGVRLLERAGKLEQAVNLSSTSIKAALARGIAVSCVYRFRELLRHEATQGEECLVVGFGQLGRWVAALLAQLGLVVRVVDPLASAQAAAEAAGFPVFPNLADAASSSVRYVFGCSGERSIGWSDVSRLGHDVVLCALSSQDLLPVISSLNESASTPVRGLGTRYRVDGRQVTVLADGHAINLHYAEGVSEPDFDAFTTLTGVAIVQAASALQSGTPGPLDAESLCEQVRDLQKQAGV